MVKFTFLLLLFLPFLQAFSAVTNEGQDIIGTKAPEFEDLIWLNTEPITIEELRVKVVLIRFWLVDCPYCPRFPLLLLSPSAQPLPASLVSIPRIPPAAA